MCNYGKYLHLHIGSTMQILPSVPDTHLGNESYHTYHTMATVDFKPTAGVIHTNKTLI